VPFAGKIIACLGGRLPLVSPDHGSGKNILHPP